MDAVQEQHEEAVIQDFAAWHNQSLGSHYRYIGRPSGARPDGLLRDGVAFIRDCLVLAGTFVLGIILALLVSSGLGLLVAAIGAPSVLLGAWWLRRLRTMPVEVGGGYYDSEHAKFLWLSARGAGNAPDSWSGENPEEGLVEALSNVVASKTTKPYPPRTALVLHVNLPLTTVAEMADLCPRIVIPATHPFRGIYVTGHFAASSDDPRGGFYAWRLTGR